MKSSERQTQNGPSYSPRQMFQGSSAAGRLEDQTSRQRRPLPAVALPEDDSRECAAYLGED